MKGVIFNLLEEFITETWGYDKYEEILERCHGAVRKAYVGPGTYKDEELYAIAGTAAEILGVALPDALRAFGKFAFAGLVKRYPMFVQGYSHPREFLLSVDKVIHVEVRKLMRDANPPRFSYADRAAGGLKIEYHSQRKLCPLMEGLLDGAADYFRVPIRHRQERCLLQGADCCEFHLEFLEAQPC